jgi:hypothetical protein
VDTGQIVGISETEIAVTVLVDLGIKGTPKYTVSKSDLLDLATPEPEAFAEVFDPAYLNSLADATKGAIDMANAAGLDLRELGLDRRIGKRDVEKHLGVKE